MSFFGKLKDRLFKSSSRLSGGIEDLVAENPSPTEAEAPVPAQPEPAPAHGEAPAQSAPAPQQVSPAQPAPPQPAPVQPAPVQHVPATQPVQPAPVQPVPVQPAPVQPLQAAPAPAEPTEVPAEPFTTYDITPEKREPEAKPGFFARLTGQTEAKRLVDDEMLESLEDLLIRADMGVETSARVTANIAEGRFGRRITASELRGALATEVARILEPVAKPLPIYRKKPQVVLVVGVNGSGKTTTIGKLASQFKAAGKHVIIAAGDTFRAAAVEQLQVWGTRAGVPVLTAAQGSDPASLAFDALTRAQAEGADLLLIDTAGRLQNRADLMEELAKIIRVIRKVDPDAPHNTLLVLDATTGQNALSQVEIFRKIADVTGLVMTKLDGTARGGVLVALADKFGLPIHAIGVGEQIDDLAPFDPEDFARALVGEGPAQG